MRLIRIFFAILSILYCTCAISTVRAAVPSPQSYEQAKLDLERLYKDEKRNKWREPWEKLAKTFLDIYIQEKDWVNRPASLYRSALAMDELARRSFSAKDAKAACERYLEVADKHKINPLADNALLAVARLQAERMNDLPGALKTVDRLCSVYPKSEECSEGRVLLKNISQDAEKSEAKKAHAALDPPAKKTQGARISSLSWVTRDKVVRVILDLDRPVAWELKSSAGRTKEQTPSLTLELNDAKPDSSVTPGAKISGSSLTRVRLDYHKSGMTRLLLNYSKLERFSIHEENDGKRLVVESTMLPKELAGGLTPGNSIRSQRAVRVERKTNGDSRAFWVATHNIASQFGLDVRTVMIDAGHGGKDPGTHHNGILEREIALDISKRLGKILKAEGFDVKYTRTNDKFLSLNERTKIANRDKADIFISLHINASSNPQKTGFETYYLDVSSSTAAASLASFENMLSNRKLGDLENIIADLMRGARKDESVRLARDVQQKTISHLSKKGLGMHNGGIRGAPFVVLMGTNMPAILVEAGYCTNKAEAKRLNSAAFRNDLARGIANGISAYAERLRKR